MTVNRLVQIYIDADWATSTAAKGQRLYIAPIF